MELGFEWINDWHVDMNRLGVDNEGWDYAFNWEFKYVYCHTIVNMIRFSDTPSPTSFVRKRRWIRTMRHKLTKEFEMATEETKPNGSETESKLTRKDSSAAKDKLKSSNHDGK